VKTFAVALLAAFLISCSGNSPESSPTQPPPATPLTLEEATPAPAPSPLPPGLVQARVVRVVDGDTIEVDIGLGSRATLRFIGVDTPETVAPGRPVDCFGPEAAANTKLLLDGKTVYLEKDVSETDRFQRLLRYVYLEDGRMVNEILVRDGFAQIATFPPDVKYQTRFLAAQVEARNANRGLGASATPRPRRPPRQPWWRQRQRRYRQFPPTSRLQPPPRPRRRTATRATLRSASHAIRRTSTVGTSHSSGLGCSSPTRISSMRTSMESGVRRSAEGASLTNWLNVCWDRTGVVISCCSVYP
jgi:micrococcal nuclease